MNLKNYTSSVPMLNSIQKIEFKLAQAGATHIAKSYENEKPIGMIFQIEIDKIPTTFKLPAKSDKVYDLLLKGRKSIPTNAQKEIIKLQADRTAWKILSDWVDIQISMIMIEHVEILEVFLPYAFDGKTNQTFFEKIKDNGFKLLKDNNG